MSELAGLCPICHQQNACSMALGQDISSCWCVDSTYSAVELILQYVTRYPDKAIRADQCVCVSCLAKIAQITATEPSAVQLFIP